MTVPDDQKIKVLVVDSQPFVRQGIKAYLNASGYCEVVGEAADGYAAVLAAVTCNPQLVILETTTNGVSGTGITAYEATKRLLQAKQSLRILVCYHTEDPFELHELLQAGVCGLLQKSAEPDELLNAVRAVMGGGTYLSRSMISKVFPVAATPAAGVNLYGLTPRETEILRYVADGLSNKEIANRIDLSVRTVETHRLNIRRKTNANTLSDLVRVARRLQLVRPPGSERG